MQTVTTGHRDMQRSLLIGLLGITLLLLNSVFLQVRTAIYYNDTTDLSAYFAAAQLKQVQPEGIYKLENLQAQAGEQVHGRIRPYLYPPWFAELLASIVGSDFVKFHVGWILISHAVLAGLFLITLLLIDALTGALNPVKTLVCLAGFALFAPVERELFYGQVSLLLSMLVWLAVLQYPRQRDFLSGALVALATMIKIYPVVLLTWFLVNRRYLSLAGFVVCAAFVAGFSVLKFGAADWIDFLHLHFSGDLLKQAYSVSPDLFMNAPNHSPIHLVYMLGIALGKPIGLTSAVWLGRLVVLAAGLLFLWYVRASLWKQRHSLEVVAALLIGMMLLSPVLWNHIFLFLMPAMIIFLAVAIQDDQRMPDLPLLLVAVLGISMADYSTNISIFNHSALVLLKPVKLYSMLLLLIFVGRRIRRGNILAFGSASG